MGPLGLSDSPLLHFGLPSASMLGALGGLGQRAGRNAEGEDEEEEGEEGGVLNLSAGVGHRSDPLSWVVVPPRALLLKPAIVS